MVTTNKGLMISAPRKSSGKTTLTLGISAALVAEGANVRVFKKGPDYIDPMWHQMATGCTCYNIDSYWMEDDLCRQIFKDHSVGMDYSLVEGNHGLHDGLDLLGANSGAYLAKLLDIPVLLVVDSSGMNRGVAAVVLGHQQLDTEVTIGGVVLNNVASPRQAGKQVSAIEHYCGIPVVGAMPKTLGAAIKERHLGLVTTYESSGVTGLIASLGQAVADNCNMAQIKAIARESTIGEPLTPPILGSPKVKIGVAYDDAFCFYYPDNLEALVKSGAELVLMNTMKDDGLPDVDAVYIGGGFPESFLAELEANFSFRRELKERIEGGMPVYAECGGLMYLTRSIQRLGQKRNMVGALPADVQFFEKPVGKGYSELSPTGEDSWFKPTRLIKGHEFHYSKLTNLGADLRYNFKVVRGTGVDGEFDGIIYNNVLAGYTHIHSQVVPEWASAFVDFAAKCQRK